MSCGSCPKVSSRPPDKDKDKEQGQGARSKEANRAELRDYQTNEHSVRILVHSASRNGTERSPRELEAAFRVVYLLPPVATVTIDTCNEEHPTALAGATGLAMHQPALAQFRDSDCAALLQGCDQPRRDPAELFGNGAR